MRRWVWVLVIVVWGGGGELWGDFMPLLTTIGDPGNAPDLVWEGNPYVPDDDVYIGAVGYTYRITTYEITVGQYVDFLNHKARSDPHGLYHPDMADPLLEGGAFILRSGEEGSYVYTAVAGKENQPVRYVSFWDGLRLANWMHNGQGDGDTEDGAYTLTNGIWLTRNPGARWALPSNDEWHKAAHYDPATGEYREYPNGKDTIEEPSDETTPRELNYGADPYWRGSVVFTSIGETTGHSAYGVYDMGGNVREWTDSLNPPGQGHYRIIRGGMYDSASNYLARDGQMSKDPSAEGVGYGLRLVYLVPEPGVSGLVMVGGGMLLGCLRRRGRWC